MNTITSADLYISRTAKEWVSFAELYNLQWKSLPASIQKLVQDEVMPIIKISQYIFDSDPDARVKLIKGNGEIDAIIMWSNGSEQPLQITSLNSYEDALKREYMASHGRVSGTGDTWRDKETRELKDYTMMIEVDESLNELEQVLAQRYLAKNNKGYASASSMWLIIDCARFVDGSNFQHEEDISRLRRFVCNLLSTHPLKFSKLLCLKPSFDGFKSTDVFLDNLRDCQIS